MSQRKPNGQWGSDRGQTANPGTDWASLPTHDCDEVTIHNASATAIDVRAAGSTHGVKLADGATLTLKVSGDSQEVQIKRTDDSNTQVYVGFLYRRANS